MVFRRIDFLMDILVRPLREPDLPQADRIFRLAFGTFNGLQDPLQFGGDLDKIRTRWLADPAAAFGAEADGTLVGSNFVTHWGRVGYFGPLTVHPDFWDRGVGQKLVEPAIGLFEAWGCRHTGLYTFSASPKHLALYQKFGFWPRALTAILSKAVRPVARVGEVSLYSQAEASKRPGLVAAAARLTDAIFAGLDVQREILALQNQGLGDTVLIWDDPGLVGFGAVHVGAGSEAGSGCGFVKFGAARPGLKAGEYFDRLLSACGAYAAAQGAQRLIAGVSLARKPAYEHMRARGFKPEVVGVCMHKPNEPGYHREDAWVMDDWR
jgi:GNAT superfamily N-acetyltransferase